MTYVFPPEATETLPVVGSDLTFPARRIVFAGRNYAAHAAEMGGEADSEARHPASGPLLQATSSLGKLLGCPLSR